MVYVELAMQNLLHSKNMTYQNPLLNSKKKKERK